jgi:hypothetical protein
VTRAAAAGGDGEKEAAAERSSATAADNTSSSATALTAGRGRRALRAEAVESAHQRERFCRQDVRAFAKELSERIFAARGILHGTPL